MRARVDPGALRPDRELRIRRRRATRPEDVDASTQSGRGEQRTAGDGGRA